jgi:phage-related tail fiber protein
LAVLGTIYGETDGAGGVGSTHFRLPDLRGNFPRGWDHGAGVDPDAASRTDRGDGTGGDNIGSKQAEAYLGHVHNVDPPSRGTTSAGGHNHSHTRQSGSAEPASGSGAVVANDNWITAYTGYAGNHSHSVNIPAFDSASSGGNETRPVNINLMFIMKY